MLILKLKPGKRRSLCEGHGAIGHWDYSRAGWETIGLSTRQAGVKIGGSVAGRRTWLDGRIDVLLAALGEYGMDASRTSAAELVEERVQWVATHMRITLATARRYLTDDALRDLARTMVVTVADEAPGADLLASPRASALPITILGRAVAGLSEAIVLRLGERNNLEHIRTTTAQLAQTLSALGQVAAERPDTKKPVTGVAGRS
jgi:hypothetical protein